MAPDPRSPGAARSRAALAGAIARASGVRHVLRPVAPDADTAFDLAYLRAGAPSAAGRPPAVVIPGGPGVATVLPYRRFRAEAGARGLDVIMVEHRGVGLSRTDPGGRDLPRAAMSVRQVVDDVAAVLDAEGVDRAVVYGSSYGSYVAAAFGARHPGRVAAMVLDSPVLTARDHLAAREEMRRLYLDGATPATATAAGHLRALLATGDVAAEESGTVVAPVHELAGPRAVERLLEVRRRGGARRVWTGLLELAAADGSVPMLSEPELTDTIAFGELGFGPEPDGLPLDVDLHLAERARRFPITGEVFDLPAALPGFTWPTAVLSGDRDLTTPRSVARRTVALTPDAVLVPLREHGHSALDTHRDAALAATAAMVDGRHRDLPALAPALDRGPRRGAGRPVGAAISVQIGASALLTRLR